MTILNKSISVIGSSAVVGSVTLYPQTDGSVLLVANGSAVDNLAETIQLDAAKLQVTGLAVIDNLMARALIELRKKNGLET